MVSYSEFRKILPIPVDSAIGKVCTTFAYGLTAVGIENGISTGNYAKVIIGVGLVFAALAATYWYNSAHDDDDYGDS
jgi:hypothetical protein